MTAPRRARFRLWPLSTALLVLLALGTAGFAVAADHQPAAEQQRAADALAVKMRDVEPQLADVEDAARRVAGDLQALNFDAVAAALTDGDAAVARLELTLPALASEVGSLAGVPDQWRGIRAVAGHVTSLVGSLERHEQVVFAATGAARDSNWDAAIELLAEAGASLAEAAAARAALAAAEGDVATLDDLLGRYEAYDVALAALYGHVRDTGSQDGADFDELRDDVERAQAALPRNDDVLTVIVGETASPAIAYHLVAVEQARDAVAEALAK